MKCRKNRIISTYHDSYVEKTVKFVHSFIPMGKKQQNVNIAINL